MNNNFNFFLFLRRYFVYGTEKSSSDIMQKIHIYIYICFTEKRKQFDFQIRHHANYICICFTTATVNLRQMGTLCVANFSDIKEGFQLN